MKTFLTSLLAALIVGTPLAEAQMRVLQVAYTPTKRAQVAIWIERTDGSFLQTVMLTEAVALHGIGNRPGAMQMNSGFRWPYGRREGVFPVWSHRRAAAPGAQLFPRLIFQVGRPEGYASGAGSSPDPFYCLSFNDRQNDDIDTVTCASVFASDKGRFLDAADVQNGYSEPFQIVPLVSTTRTLSTTSLYPMRRDILGNLPNDSPEASSFADIVRNIMPDIDAVTRATAPADTTQLLTHELPAEWPDGEYVLWVEVNTERDLNAVWSEAAHPTPVDPDPAYPNDPNHNDHLFWDTWSEYGYAYRGQPSIVYRVPFHVDATGGTWTAATAEGYGELHGLDGVVRPIDATITDDSVNAPGSGIDRLRYLCSARVAVSTVGFEHCENLPPVPAVENVVAEHVADKKHSHEWAHLSFTAVGLGADDASGYQVKISTSPITNEIEFMQATDAKAATSEFEGLNVCPILAGSCLPTTMPDCPTAGTAVELDIGQLRYFTHYYVAIRALGNCGTKGPITTAEFETTAIEFTTVAPCFVATAAHGSAMANEVQALRTFRNEHLMPSTLGRAFVRGYYAFGPTLADVIAERGWLRSVARAVLRPFVLATDVR